MAVAAIAAFGWAPATAGVSVHGDAAALTVEATNAMQSEILEAIAAHLDMMVRSNAALDRDLTLRAYDARLVDVIARSLENRSFVLLESPAGDLHLFVLGESSAPAAAGDVPVSASALPANIRLADPDPVVREDAVHELMASGHRTRLDWVAAMLDDPDRQVRLAAIEALGECDDETAVTMLASHFDRLSSSDRLEVVEALADNPTVAATRLLLAAQHDARLARIASDYLADRVLRPGLAR